MASKRPATQRMGSEIAIKGIKALLQHILSRDCDESSLDDSGVKDTPERVYKYFMEVTKGYQMSPEYILNKRFATKYDEMIWLRNIRFTSLCEHHLLTFSGTCSICYVPEASGGVVGISKLARLVECFSQRLQIQERLTFQIADALDTYLKPQGVAVLIKAHHSCMGCRGVKQPEAEMITSCLRGCFRDGSAKEEFLRYA